MPLLTLIMFKKEAWDNQPYPTFGTTKYQLQNRRNPTLVLRAEFELLFEAVYFWKLVVSRSDTAKRYFMSLFLLLFQYIVCY